MILATTAGAQSTSQVGHREPIAQYEVSVGAAVSGNSSYCCDRERTGMASVGVRWSPGDVGAIRLAVVALDRRSDYDFGSGYTDHRRDRVLATTTSADAFFRLRGDFGASLSAGIGFAPYVKGEETDRSGPYAPQSSSRGMGGVLTGSAGLRYRWLVIEQRAFFVHSPDDVLKTGSAFFPVSVGIRF